MDTLFDCLSQNKFTTADAAIEFCREQCLEYGFNIRKELTTNRSISICCSREDDGFQRKKAQCPWQMIVYEEKDNIWSFRAPSCEHNHSLTPLEGDSWHPDVKEKILQLAAQKMQAHEIRETIKLQFPEITWSNRRFYNYLKEGIHLQNITDRVQRLILASTRLCSVVAANEDWASCVENDLSKLLDNYKHQTRLSTQNLNTMVDLPLDKIYSEIEKPKTKKAEEQQHQLDLATSKKRKLVKTLNIGGNDSDAHVVTVPNCTLYIRSQPLRSLSEPSSQSRRAFTDLVASNRIGGPVTVPSPFGRVEYTSDYNRNQDGLMQSPPIPDNMMVPPHLTTSSGYSNGIYPMPSSPFSPYPPSNLSASEMSFSFEGNSHSSFQPMTPNPLMVQRQQSGNSNNNTGNNNNTYSMNCFSSPLREANNSSLQQRMMIQEYEQRNLSSQQDPSSLDVHLPMIRSNVLPHSMLQHQTRMNPSEQNTWT